MVAMGRLVKDLCYNTRRSSAKGILQRSRREASARQYTDMLLLSINQSFDFVQRAGIVAVQRTHDAVRSDARSASLCVDVTRPSGTTGADML